MNALRGRAASVLIGLATAILIVTVAIVPFLTPQWVAFEQERSQAAAWTGLTTEDLRGATDSILGALVLGGEFDVGIRGREVLNSRERAHMGDVRTVFRGLWVLAAMSVVVLVLATRRRERSGTWRAVRRGALGLTVAVVATGAIALVAFDQLFAVFHQVFFPAGSYLFDPTTDRLVQLFPFQFWQESAMAVGGVIIVLALVVATTTARRTAASPAPVPDLQTAAEPGS